ncbi:MAG: AAA family ATPase [Bdellovibrio sp.]|nr:AAA family ATPase [Bdellovibrio sp.]
MTFLRTLILSALFSLTLIPTLPNIQTALAGQAEQEQALKVAPAFVDYFSKINERLLERKYILDLVKLALVSKEHLILLGPPGNAKSMLADTVLGNLVDTKSAEPPYFKLQMTPETGLSEVVGPFNYKTLLEQNEYDRVYKSGMLFAKVAFVDEFFDGRSNALRDTLTLLNERIHAQGRKVTKGTLQTVITASNTYISQVYELFQNDKPKAILDRFAFSAFVPRGFESTASHVSLIQNSKLKKSKIPPLAFEALDLIRTTRRDVKISDAMASLIYILVRDIEAELSSLEQASLKTYNEKKSRGETPAPPYRPTKFFSGRTQEKAGKIVRAIAVVDWLEKSVSHPEKLRKLEVNLQDIKKLQQFFTLNGPNSAFLEQELKGSIDPNERSQIEAILQEREVFERHFDQLVADWNRVILSDFMVSIEERMNVATPIEKENLAYEIWLKSKDLEKRRTHTTNPKEISTEQIALVEASVFLSQHLVKLLGNDYAKKLVAFEARRVEEIAQKKAREEERSRMRSQVTERREVQKVWTLAELESKFKNSEGSTRRANLKSKTSPEDFLQTRLPGSDAVVLFDQGENKLLLITPSSKERSKLKIKEVDLNYLDGDSNVSGLFGIDSNRVALHVGEKLVLFTIKGEEVAKFPWPEDKDLIFSGITNGNHPHFKVINPKSEKLEDLCTDNGITNSSSLKVTNTSEPLSSILENRAAGIDTSFYDQERSEFVFTSFGGSKVYRVKDNLVSFVTSVPDFDSDFRVNHVDERGNVFGVSHTLHSSKIFKFSLGGILEGEAPKLTSTEVKVSKFRGFSVLDGKIALIPIDGDTLLFEDLNSLKRIGSISLDPTLGSPQFPLNLGKGKLGYFLWNRSNGDRKLTYVLKGDFL